MITYVKRQDLDVVKYDACITNSAQSRVYAFSWYLDIVADNWDVLVLDDYEAVMPVPWRRKFGFKYSLQPYFCQQITIYSHLEIEDSLIKKLLKKIPFLILYSDVNFSFKLNEVTFLEKHNFSLDLNRDYELTYKNYRKDRKKSLKKANEVDFVYNDDGKKEVLIKLYQKVFSFLKMPEKYFITIDAIIDYCILHKKGFIRNIYLDNDLVCAGFFIKYNARIYYLFGASNEKGKKHGATTFLIDSVIKENSNSHIIFDFEGSTIPNVASFYRSIGSKKTTYYNLKTNVFKRIFL